MPSTNATLGSPRSTRAPQAEAIPAPAGRTAAEDKLWAALHAHPAATTGDLAAHAGIGRSTAGKILAGWATEGSVTRTSDPGPGGRRAADTWRITDTTCDQLIAAVAPDHPEAETTGVVPDAAGEGGSGEITASDPGPGEQPPTSTTPTGAGAPVPVDGAAPGQSTRLGKGALRGMVEDYLTGRAGEQLSPSAIGKALGRSSGAVSNALDKLVADGYAVQTQDKPKRFAAKTIPEALLHLAKPGRARPLILGWSDRQGQLVEGGRHPQGHRLVDAEFVVAAADVLDERVSGDDDSG